MTTSPSIRSRLARLAALGTLATALFPSDAHAQEFAGGAGLYTSFTFGDGHYGFGWGLEGLFSLVLAGANNSCSQDGRGGLGFAAQLGAIDVDTFRLVGAVHGGGNMGESTETPVIDGELGVAMHAHDQGVDVGFHTGVVVDIPFSPISAWSNFVRAEWLLNEYSVGGGVFLPSRFGATQQFCEIAGRPLRDDHGVMPLAEAPCVARLDGAALGWAEDAQAEAASVPAFLMLAAELLRARAPMHLVDRALDAAADEIRHARACAAVASTLAGTTVTPVVPRAPTRTQLGGTALLTRLAVESWLDGCLNEGSAAARARGAAARAREPRIAGVQLGIARDEARHAALGWDVLAFAVARGGDAVRDAVRSAREERVTSARELPEAEERWGQLARPASDAVNERVARHARASLDTLLVQTCVT